jgi:aldose 1-epimerase
VITAEWRLEGPGRLLLDLRATSDAPTLMNLANHSYWNLDGGGSVAGHSLSIAADSYLPTENILPTGERRPVSGAFDLRDARPFDLTVGYDHNFCLAPAPRALTEVAVLTGARGIRMRLATTEPGLQLYDGTFLTGGGFAGHGGAVYGKHEALALEPQRWPDAPNHPSFPAVTLDPGETYRQSNVWTFGRV